MQSQAVVISEPVRTGQPMEAPISELAATDMASMAIRMRRYIESVAYEKVAFTVRR